MFKVVLLGYPGAGKTSMMVRFVDDIFEEESFCTIGVDFKMKFLKTRNKVVKL